jgi:adenylylsulfate kinase-like enzyme
MVLWFIGMSGSGKTTIGSLVYEYIKQRVNNICMLDGDMLRKVWGQDIDHSVEGRRKNAERLSHLSRFLAEQDIHVIAAVLSIFPEWQQWNRAHIEDYCEVYLKVPLNILRKRDTKNLYGPALRGEIENVVGVDIPFPEPENPDLVIDNSAHEFNFQPIVDRVLSFSTVKKLIKC